MDGDREDLNITEDAIEMSDAEAVLDDFSIPDELDEMQGMSEEELAEEDRLVTVAEYRAEIEAENEAYDDLLHGEVIDVDGSVINSKSEFPESLKQVELMDGELRQAIEIYVTECSSIKPYQPFLKVIYESNLLPPDKISFVIRTINHSGKEYSQAYSNNAYGLIEYNQSQMGVVVNYKGSDGERHKSDVTFEQIYEVCAYLIKTGSFVGKEQEDRFNQLWSETPYDMAYNENNLNVGWESADEYLSGNVRDKLRIAKAFAENDPELFGVNAKALEQVQPLNLDASEIDVRMECACST